MNQDKIGEADGMNLEVEIKLKNGIGSRSQVGCSNKFLCLLLRYRETSKDQMRLHACTFSTVRPYTFTYLLQIICSCADRHVC